LPNSALQCETKNKTVKFKQKTHLAARRNENITLITQIYNSHIEYFLTKNERKIKWKREKSPRKEIYQT
jgi:hypothetical protein